tara:strand:+ start:1870 stop:2397 length:528 start_codon:yes stop_codon:yes gene_type:complete
MARFASTKYAKGISDRSGREYPLNVMLLEWNGLLVGPDEYEPKQPQLTPPRIQPDPQALRISRPARTEPPVEVILPFNPFESANTGSPIVRITEPGSTRVVGDKVRLRSTEAFDGFTSAALEYSSGYTVVKVYNTNVPYDYAIDISESGSSETGTVGTVTGGGGTASAGPVTVEA